MILGIGVDIVHLPRIAAVIKRQSSEKLARRILSSSELQQWIQLRDSDIQQQVRFLGVRWAVKEAAYKALYSSAKPTWKELSYQSLTESGKKPSLVYRPFATRLNGKVGTLHVSVSHDGDYATAYVIAEDGISKGPKLWNLRL